jgi:DNA-binding NtrC family response regulator
LGRKPKVLVVDDELAVRESLGEWLQEEGYEVGLAEDGPAALNLLKRDTWDVMLLDLKMPGMSGLDVIKESRETSPETEVIMMTAFATVDTAVLAMKEGAFDYLVKPFDPDEMELQIRKVVAHKEIVAQNIVLRQELEKSRGPDEIIGVSAAMQEVFQLVTRVAPSESTVLITGESGTGKELVARAIHCHSPRLHAPFVAVNCAALPETLLESELFGHEKGAFTGAETSKKGRFELANRGTIFLDEIGDVTPKTQVNLLRVLEEREVVRLGGQHSIGVDVRVVAASNQDLKRVMAEDRFREDLYFRLNVIQIHLPPLRERMEDVPPLVRHLIKRLSFELGLPRAAVSPAAMRLLGGYHWPGNVRELKNVLERAMVIGHGSEITPDNLPFDLRAAEPPEAPGSLKEMERLHIARVLGENSWNISKSARVLEIDRQTLYNKIEKYGLKAPGS